MSASYTLRTFGAVDSHLSMQEFICHAPGPWRCCRRALESWHARTRL